MIKPVVTGLITLALMLSGCTHDPVETKASTPSIVISDSAVDSPVLLAHQAYRDDEYLYIQFQQAAGTVNSFALLPAPDQLYPATTDQDLQAVVEQYNSLPVAQLAYLDPEQWMERTYPLESIPIAGAALWHEFRDELLAEITPEQPGKGVVVEFLKQEEMFFYYDLHGRLQSSPLHDKPAGLKTGTTYKFSQLLKDATVRLDKYITAAGGISAKALLFNTGDDTEFGYPFIYASRDSGQVVFLRRLPENPDCCKPPNTLLTDALTHTTRSHIDCFFRQPIGSVARLFTLVSFKVVDTVTPKPVVLLKDQPIPAVADAAPMDLEAWEQELDGLSYSPRSQGTIEYLVDGAAFFPRLVDAIQAAEESIDIRLYIFDNDDYAMKIANLLKQRSQEVNVRILVDGLGTISAASFHSDTMPQDYTPPRQIIQYLEQDSNIKVRTVLNPWLAGDHTKTILVDRQTAFLGGMNIGREYRYDWHDLMVEMHGPVVDEIQTKFEKAWRQQSFLGEFRAALYRPAKPLNRAGPDDIPVRLLLTRPGDSQILRAQIAAIGRAQQRIYIENAYFTSDDIIFELAMARRRGVDVRVIIPYQSDSGVIDRSNVLAINAMLDNGIRVYLYPGESHIKGAVYDGWICLGSANFDQLSLRMNKELNIATSDPAAVQGFVDKVIQPDFDKAIELTGPLPEKWSDFLLEIIADHL